MDRAVWKDSRAIHSPASEIHVLFRSSSSTFLPTVTLTISKHVFGCPLRSAVSASLSQNSLSMETPLFARLFTARSMILPTKDLASAWSLVAVSTEALSPATVASFASFASSSFAAAIHTRGSSGSVSRALFKTTRAFSLVSSRANASHKSTCCGQHSVALARRTFASVSLDKSTSAFHSRTDDGIFSRAFRSTCRFRSSSSSSCVACIHRSTFRGMCATARAKIALASSAVLSRAFSLQTSGFMGHASHPFCAKDRAALIFPASSSNLAAAIQPGACFGFVFITDFSNSLAFLTSLISAVDEIFWLCSEVKYPVGSTTVCPLTLSPMESSFSPRTAPRPSPTAVRSLLLFGFEPTPPTPTPTFPVSIPPPSSYAFRSFSAMAF
mmetsp:Transcript_2203/g.8463  ORF Transcript_2203/g.8463 Transcript_2203/m.8463 type:complete len:384 (+) Transcript_2203:502-1653(+)